MFDALLPSIEKRERGDIVAGVEEQRPSITLADGDGAVAERLPHNEGNEILVAIVVVDGPPVGGGSAVSCRMASW